MDERQEFYRWRNPRLELPEADADVFIACTIYGDGTKAILKGEYDASKIEFHDEHGGLFAKVNDFWHVTLPFNRREDKMYFWCYRDAPPRPPWDEVLK